MAELTTRERFQRMYDHRPADRVPWMENLWGTTARRWRREGLPEGVDYREYFGLDMVQRIIPEYSPRFPHETLRRDERYHVFRNQWGSTLRAIVDSSTPPESLDFPVTDRESWEAYKLRMQPGDDRVDWAKLEREYPLWRRRGDWVVGQFWFGFDVTHARVTGTERMLLWMIEDPELVRDIWGHFLELSIAMMDRVWERGFEVDEIHWPDDLGYKHSQFFSLSMYRDLLKPFQQRAIDWAHRRGVKVRLHSCGDVSPFVADWVEMGVDALNPLEVKAGMDPAGLKERYGDRLVLHGGINAVLWDRPDDIAAEMERVLPVLKEGGGYIFASDHSVPDSVSLADFTRIVELYRRLGRYD